MKRGISAAIFLCPILVAAGVLGYRSGCFSVGASYILFPFIFVQNKVASKVNSWSESLKTNRHLCGELELARTGLEAAISENVELKAKSDFKKETVELLKFKRRYDASVAMLGQVIFRSFTPSTDFFLVNLGSNDGVQVDMVAVYKNCLVGRVSEVRPTYSRIQLLTDRECRVSVFASKTKANGVCEGQGDGEWPQMAYVSHLSKIVNGDTVLTSGEGLIFPRGFGVGKIESHVKEGVSYTITLKPLTDVTKINYCYLLGAKNG